MILFSIFLLWLLIGYGILRLQRSMGAEVENGEGQEVPVRWCYKIPIKLIYCLALGLVAGIFVYLYNVSYFDLCFDEGLAFYASNVLGISGGLSASPLLRIFYYCAIFFYFSFISSLSVSVLSYIFTKFFPSYYAYSLKQSKTHNIFTKSISFKYMMLVLAVSLAVIYYIPMFFFIAILIVFPFAFGFMIFVKFLRFVGVGEISSLTYVRILKSTLKHWLIFGVVVCAGLCFSPIYVLTEKSLIVSIFNGMKEVNWSEVIDLELKVEQSSSGRSSSSGFDKYRYSVSANASSKLDLNLELFSLESKDTLNKIVDIFKNNGIPIKCKVDGSLDAVLGGVDLSKLTKSEKDQFEILSYVNKTCKK